MKKNIIYEKYSRKLYLMTSPLGVIIFSWLLAIFIYKIASTLDSDYDYFYLLIHQEGIIDRSTVASYVLLFVAFVSYALGVLYISITFNPNRSEYISNGLDVNSAIKSLTVAFLFTATIAFLWIGVAVVQFGGILNMAAVAASENTVAREAILAASFPGGRLISSGFVGLSVYCTVLLTYNEFYSNKQKIIVSLMFSLSLLYLGIVPILTSGRVNFFIAILGSFIAACYVKRRTIEYRYILIGAVFLGVVWTAKQYFTLGHIAEEASATKQSIEGLLFYFYNDILNVLNTIDKTDGNYTYGWYSMRFVFYFTFTDKLISQLIVDDRQYYNQFISAGEVPMLGAHVVDFGYLGFISLFLIGVVTQYFYLKAINRISYAAVYGLICACLLLSTHSSYLTSQEIIYSMILLRVLFWKTGIKV